MAGYPASALDLCRAYGLAPARASPETEFGRRGARTRCGHIRPCGPGLPCDGLSDLFCCVYTSRYRPHPGRPRTLLRRCSADGCDLPRRDHQYRSASRGRRDGSDLRIIALGRYELPSTAGGTLVGAVTHGRKPCRITRSIRVQDGLWAYSGRMEIASTSDARMRRNIEHLTFVLVRCGDAGR